MGLAELADAKPNRARVAVLDIETAPSHGWFFQLKTDYINPSMVTEYGRTICFAASIIDGPMLFSSEWDHGREGMIRSAHALLDAADIVVTWNGDRFDLRHLRKEMALIGLAPPSPYKSVDLVRVSRQQFAFESHKLDEVAKRLDVGEKMTHQGFGLWKGVLAGDPEARRTMRLYNIQDVRITERVYYELLPWIKNHPHVVKSDSELLCNRCGSDKLTQRGTTEAILLSYPLFQCDSCGGWVKSLRNDGRIGMTRGA